MKLALLQCDIVNGDLAGNAAKIADFCKKAGPADLCVAPVQALAGPEDACPAEEEIQAALNLIAAKLPPGKTLLCGLPERRYFLVEPGALRETPEIFTLDGLTIGIDLTSGASADLDLCLSIAARPFSPGIQSEWEMVLSGMAMQTGAPIASVNLVGGYGGLIYNGQSVAVDRSGNIAARAKSFAEDILILDSDGAGRLSPLCESELAGIWQALCLGTRDFIKKAGAQKALIGLSGGMDSAFVACVATEALGPDNVTGILMPSDWTSAESIRDAEELAANLGIKTFSVPIASILAAYESGLQAAFKQVEPVKGDLTRENLQARIRGAILMAFSNRSGALVLNTGNKSELAMGYCTLYGDTAGALSVIGDLFKTQVYKLAAWRNGQAGRELIPRNIFEKAPSAELRPGQKDTDSLPPYEELDPALERALAACAPTREDAAMRAKMKKFEFKRRQCPPVLLVSGLALSRLWQCACME